MTITPPVIKRYFARAADPNREAYLAQFSDDAVVTDEGHTHRGVAAIRAWRSSVPPVAYGVRAVEATEHGHRAVTEISGDFPGSPVTLAFDFTLTSDEARIRALTIGPLTDDDR